MPLGAMLDFITIISTVGLQQELHKVNGDQSFMIHEGGDLPMTASLAEIVEEAAEPLSQALGAIDSALSEGMAMLGFGGSPQETTRPKLP